MSATARTPEAFSLVSAPSGLLDRNLSDAIDKRLGQYLEVVKEIVDYGVDLIQRMLITSDRDVPSIVLIPVLGRQVVAMLDSLHMLLVNGQVYASALPLRSLMEARLAVEWIITNGKTEWARRFYVAELRRRRHFTADSLRGSKRFEQLKG